MTNVRLDTCPSCGSPMIIADGLNTVEAGHFVICLECDAVLRYDQDLKLALASRREIRKLNPSERAQLRDLVAHVHRMTMRDN